MSDDEGSSPRARSATPVTQAAKAKKPVKKQPLQTVLMDLWKKIYKYVYCLCHTAYDQG